MKNRKVDLHSEIAKFAVEETDGGKQWKIKRGLLDLLRGRNLLLTNWEPLTRQFAARE